MTLTFHFFFYNSVHVRKGVAHKLVIGCKTGMKGWISIVVYRDKLPTMDLG